MKKLQYVFLIIGIIMLLNSIMFCFGALSHGLPFDALIDVFPGSKLIIVVVSFIIYFALRYFNSKNINNKR